LSDILYILYNRSSKYRTTSICNYQIISGGLKPGLSKYQTADHILSKYRTVPSKYRTVSSIIIEISDSDIGVPDRIKQFYRNIGQLNPDTGQHYRYSGHQTIFLPKPFL
ncbi:hypothetical protein LLG10_03565, partial [bacterium]|nr:hypothetical protein [bacterium]